MATPLTTAPVSTMLNMAVPGQGTDEDEEDRRKKLLEQQQAALNKKTGGLVSNAVLGQGGLGGY